MNLLISCIQKMNYAGGVIRSIPIQYLTFGLFASMLIQGIQWKIFFIGLCIVIILANITKKLFSYVNKPWAKRPKSAGAKGGGCLEFRNCNADVSKTESQPGMYSSHTSSAFYVFSFILIYLITRSNRSLVEFWLPCIVVSLMTILVPIERLSTKCHSLPQVISGSIVGTLGGIVAAALAQ